MPTAAQASGVPYTSLGLRPRRFSRLSERFDVEAGDCNLWPNRSRRARNREVSRFHAGQYDCIQGGQWFSWSSQSLDHHHWLGRLPSGVANQKLVGTGLERQRLRMDRLWPKWNRVRGGLVGRAAIVFIPFDVLNHYL